QLRTYQHVFERISANVNEPDCPLISPAENARALIGLHRQDGQKNIAAALRRAARDYRRPLALTG
uniref:hypothetical protein n=1 Tax=Streptomyces sp. NRRL S-813 TaxID=1463919 RepID=UPI0004C279EC